MKMRYLLTLFATALAIHAGVPAGAETLTAPTNVKFDGMDAFAYGFVKKFVLDIDSNLQDQGILAPSCTFRPKNSTPDFNGPGVGSCLYKALMSSTKTADLAGSVYAWIKDRFGRYHPVEIQWRPPQGGLGKLIKQAIEMRLEKPLFAVRKKIWGLESAEKLRYSEFIGGDLKIILPQDPEALEVLASRGGTWAKNYLAKADSMDFHISPESNDQGKVVYSGALVINHRGVDGDAGNDIPEATKLYLRTNVNVVVLKRPFFLNAKLRHGEESADPLPPINLEAAP